MIAHELHDAGQGVVQPFPRYEVGDLIARDTGSDELRLALLGREAGTSLGVHPASLSAVTENATGAMYDEAVAQLRQYARSRRIALPAGELLCNHHTDDMLEVERSPLNQDPPRDQSAELLRRVAGGDRLAFSTLYLSFAPRVLGLITRLLRDRAQAEEVAQEVFLEVWQTAPRFNATKGAPTSWIMTMAHRRAVDRVRASQASRDRDLRVGIRNHEPDWDSVSETVEVKLDNQSVAVALGLLTELQRHAIVLTYYEGRSTAEAAMQLGVPVATVKTRARDGLLRLRTLMRDTAPETL